MKFSRLIAAAALASAGLCTANAALAADVVVDVTGAKSFNQLLEDGNTVWYVDIGANAVLTSVAWNVTLSAVAPSTLADMQVSFGRSDGVDLVNLTPDALGDSGAGSYSGSLDLTGWGLGAGADGKLRIEFNEAFDDFAPGMAEGEWVSGSLTFGVSAVPEPSTALLAALGAGVIAGARRRRRA